MAFKATQSEAQAEKVSTSTFNSQFFVIPAEDRRLVRQHGLGLQDYWLDCWEADPYGSRYVLMPDADLKNTTQAKYRKQLERLKLFMFEVRKQGSDRKLWVLNLHGVRTKSLIGLNKLSRDSIEQARDGTSEKLYGTEQIRDGVERLLDGIEQNEAGMQSQQALQNASISFHYLSKSSSTSLADLREEDLKLKETEREVSQIESVAPVKPAIPVEPVAPVEPIPQLESVASVEPTTQVEPIDKIIDNQPASLVEKPKLRNKPINPVVDNQPPAQPIHSDEAIDKDFLLWVMEVKLPTLKLREAPINVEAYAKGMIRRDGDKLQAEYACVVAEQRYSAQMAELTVQVEERVREWSKVSDARLMAYHNLDGEPMVLMDGIEIGGADFLNKPIQVAPMVQTIQLDEEIRAQRPARMSRLKLAAKLALSPGLEFLQECWGDILLRSQVRIAIAKYPSWAVVRDGELQAARE